MSERKVLSGNNIEVLKTYPDNSIDCVVTDAPYGLGKEPNAVELIKDWIEKGHHEVKGSGFMGNSWDTFVPQPLFWKEVYRVLKPGGHVLCFFGTRTYDWGVMSMRFAGFEVRDCITAWIYSSGFPKSHNLSKNIDKQAGAEREVVGKKKGTFADIKRDKETGQDGLHGGVAKDRDRVEVLITAPATEEAKKWDGWGTALKPACEIITVCRKPLEAGLTIADNVLKYGTGGINIDACRIGLPVNTVRPVGKSLIGTFQLNQENHKESGRNDVGRFPANTVFCHHPECVYNGMKKIKAISGGTVEKSMGALGKNGKYGKYALDRLADNAGGVGDENGQETVEDWTCHPDCQIRTLDEQTGVLKSGTVSPDVFKGEYTANIYGKYANNSIDPKTVYGDKGGGSRFFLNTAFDEEEKSLFFYQAKASKSERNEGLDGLEKKNTRRDDGQPYGMNTSPLRPDGSERKPVAPSANFHPTVKPVQLMRYLIKLVMPPGGVGLDPFVGSGTTLVAAALEDFNFIGIDQEEDYCAIAKERLAHAEKKLAQIKSTPTQPKFF